jgi:hypothetical protein
MARLFVLCVVVAGLAASCALTMSPDRSQRISDCLAQCEQVDPKSGSNVSPQNGVRDQRSPCEQRCHAQK